MPWWILNLFFLFYSIVDNKIEISTRAVAAFRKKIVNGLIIYINLLNWENKTHESLLNWKSHMLQEENAVDKYFLELASHVLKRKIIIHNVINCNDLELTPQNGLDRFLHLLYFEAEHFGGHGYYHSIVPIGYLEPMFKVMHSKKN